MFFEGTDFFSNGSRLVRQADQLSSATNLSHRSQHKYSVLGAPISELGGLDLKFLKSKKLSDKLHLVKHIFLHTAGEVFG